VEVQNPSIATTDKKDFMEMNEVTMIPRDRVPFTVKLGLSANRGDADKGH
jgi:hypothetical protein